MPVEGPIVDLSSLNADWPLEEDLQSFTDDHLRLTKDAIKKAFTDMSTNGGVVTVTAAEINHLAGTTSNVQAQIDNAAPNWRYSIAAAEVLTNNTKLLANPAPSGMLITLPNAPLQGTEVQIIDVGGVAAPPDNEILVQRAGLDTIFDLDTDTAGLSIIQFTRDGEYRYFAYEAVNFIWFSWSIN